MKVLLNYNFAPDDIVDGDFSALFERKRRDSTFAFVFEDNEHIYAIRDHLGIVPLYYRCKDGRYQFSTNFSDLIESGDKLDERGLRSLLGFGTPRLFPLIEGINIVPPGSVLEIDKTNNRVRVVFQYKIKPQRISALTSMNTLVKEVEELLLNAVTRLVRYDTVGLYLSGGMDSALVGIYLKKLGVEVNAYTSAPWGRISSEIPYAKTNAEIIGVRNHYIDYLETAKYMESFYSIPEIYGIPHGTSTTIGVASLWRNTPLENEEQIFFGQNCDTMTCSVIQQYTMYFIHLLLKPMMKYLPNSIRTKLRIPHDEMLVNYISFVSKGLISQYPPIYKLQNALQISNIQLMTLAGMYIGHTPCDSEELSQPAIQRSILVSNPYYDMDLIEYCLSIPLRFRIGLSLKSKTIFSLQKRVLRKLALNYLPRDLVYRKKGFTVSLDRDRRTRTLVDLLPSSISGIRLDNIESRIAAGVLQRWCEMNGLECS